MTQRYDKAADSISPGDGRPADSGLTRMEFLRRAGAVTLLAGLLAQKPMAALSSNDRAGTPSHRPKFEFNDKQERVLHAVQMQLFPADGDGPSALDLQALNYLQWALQDPENIEDGDADTIVRGIGWLEDLSNSTYASGFTSLSTAQKTALLQQIAKSRAGENWLSLLLYYLIESLTLDPVYGGNPEGIGWRWLAHQPGYPRPGENTTYHHFI